MLADSSPPPFYPCEGLSDLTLRFGGESEGLPHDCRAIAPSDEIRSQVESLKPRLTLDRYRRNLVNPDVVPTAIRMALVIGSLVFAVNHSDALLKNEMTRNRWLSGALSFVVPYMVSVYGQTQCQLSHQLNERASS